MNKRGQALIMLSIVVIIAFLAIVFLFKDSSIDAQVIAVHAERAISQTPQTLPVIGVTPRLPSAAHISVAPSTAPLTAALPPAYKTTLTCPKISNTKLLAIPSPGGENDCDLVGKGKDIDEYLAAMEKKAATCKTIRADVWKRVLAAKTDLNKQVDALEVPPPNPNGPKSFALTSCSPYGKLGAPESSKQYWSENQHYTHWLKDIKNNVNKYCTLVDNLMKPMWTGCDEINFYNSCQVLDVKSRAQYHKYLTIEWGVAQTAYGYTDLFYSNTLQTTGWGNFKKEFNEDSLKNACPRQTVARAASLPQI